MKLDILMKIWMITFMLWLISAALALLVAFGVIR